MQQIGNNTFFGLQSELILTGGTPGSFFMATDTENLYGYNDSGEPFIVNTTGSTQNNFSRTIFITSTDLDGCGTCTGSTLEDKIVQYVNTLNYNKMSDDSDVWIEFHDDTGIFTSEFDEEFE